MTMFHRLCHLLLVLLCGVALIQASEYPIRLKDMIESLLDGTTGSYEFQKHVSQKLKETDADGGEAVIEHMEKRFREKLNGCMKAVEQINEYITYNMDDPGVTPTYSECCSNSFSTSWFGGGGGEFDPLLNTYIDKDAMCYSDKGQVIYEMKIPKDGLLDVFKQNVEEVDGIMYQHFSSNEGGFFVYPSYEESSCSAYDPRTRPWYSGTVAMNPKDIFILIDTSSKMKGRVSEMGLSYFDVAKKALNKIVGSLTTKDRVRLLPFTSTTVKKQYVTTPCFLEHMTLVSTRIQADISSYLDSLQVGGPNFLLAALKLAFRGLQPFQNTDHDTAIVLLTGAKPDSLEHHLEKMFSELSREERKHSLIIYQIGESQELADLFAKLAINYPGTARVESIKNVESLNSVAHIYNHFPLNPIEMRIIPPYLDYISGEYILTVAIPYVVSGELVGISCVDISLSAMLSDIIHYKTTLNDYFIAYDVDSQTALLHPFIPPMFDRSEKLKDIMMATLVDKSALNNLNRESSGSFQQNRSVHYIARGGTLQYGSFRDVGPATYYFATVEEKNLKWKIAYVNRHQQKNGDLTMAEEISAEETEFFYHRLDLEAQPADEACSYYDSESYKDMTSVKFSPQSFLVPAKYLQKTETAETVKEMVDVVHQETENDMFVGSVIRDVFLTSYLHRMWVDGKSKLDIITQPVSRFVATENGVFRFQPPYAFPKNYDPTHEHWYKTAIYNEDANKIMTSAHLDENGAGYIISLVHAIRLENSNMLYGVVGVNLTIHYLYMKMLSDFSSICNTQGYSCFLMDHAGYVITHKKWVTTDNTQRIKVENVHITSLEAQVADHMVSKGYLHREQCLDIFSEKQHVYYTVDLPEQGVIIRQGTRIFYQAFRAPDTNVYLVQKLDGGDAQNRCPCSVDRCELDLDKCECPCQLNFDTSDPCIAQASDELPPLCAHVPHNSRTVNVPHHHYHHIFNNLPHCVPKECATATSLETCQSIAYCRWCTHAGGEEISGPFCDDFDYCWFGQIQRTTMYELPAHDYGSNNVIIAVTAAVLSVVVVLVIAGVVAYKRKCGPCKNRNQAEYVLKESRTNNKSQQQLTSKKHEHVMKLTQANKGVTSSTDV